MSPKETYREMLKSSLCEAYAVAGDQFVPPNGVQEPEADPQFPQDPSTWTEEMMGGAAENILLGQTCHFCRIQMGCPQRNNECDSCHLFVEAMSFSVTVNGVEIKGRCLSAGNFKVVSDHIEATIPYVQEK